MKINHLNITYDHSFLCISVIRDSNVVQLDVDSEVNHVVGPLNPKPVDHREPVFVGGVPGKSYLKWRVPNPKEHLKSHKCYYSIKSWAMYFYNSPSNSKNFIYNILS